MIIEGFVPRPGEHCETNTTGNLLAHTGIELSEPMLFGIGEGLSFAVLNIKAMGGPFIGGRTRPEEITRQLADHLCLDVDFRTTKSKSRAWHNLASFVDEGQPVGVKLDMYFLDYFASGEHFAAHYVAACGYDDNNVYVVDTGQQGDVLATSRERFEQGRFWKGPMASPAMSWTVTRAGDYDLQTVLRTALAANADAHLNPPTAFLGVKGIAKAARMVPKWLDSLEDPRRHLEWMSTLMEGGGTGGALFRNFYRDFLIEAQEHVDSPALRLAADLITEAAVLWTLVSQDLLAAALDEDPRHLAEASDRLQEIAGLEEQAMTELAVL